MNETTKIILICLVTLAVSLSVIYTVFSIFLKFKMSSKRRQVEGYGKQSEQRVESLLIKAFGADVVMTGVYLPYIKLDYEKFAEIDHIVINRGGVFVIEVKSHNGYIKCPNEHDWWQTYNDKKLRFYNPLRQNSTHVKIIQDILRSEGQYNVPLRSVVVFTSNRVTFSQRYENLVRTHELTGYIKRLSKKNSISASQVTKVRKIIEYHAVTTHIAAKRHRDEMRRYTIKT